MRHVLKHTPWQTVALFSGLLVYAVFSSPTPDNFGWSEVLIAGFLGISMNLRGLLSRPFEAGCFIVALLLPLMAGFIHGNELRDILRDIIALMFFFLPLFYAGTAVASSISYQSVLGVLGFIFAVRAIIPYQSILMQPALWGVGPPADLLYLANSPEVLFAGVLGVKTVFAALDGRADKASFGIGMIMTLVPLLAMSLMAQRAGVGCMLIAVALYAGQFFYHRPLRALLLVPLLVLFFLPAGTIWYDLFAQLWHKHLAVGENGRFAEWTKVLDLVGQGIVTTIFGYGWGARFEDPAVAEISVSYTHSLVSFLLLKSGVVGLMAVLAGVGASIWMALRKDLPALLGISGFFVLLPVLMPLSVAVLLYASYKSLGFGLILCAFWDKSLRKLDKNPSPVS